MSLVATAIIGSAVVGIAGTAIAGSEAAGATKSATNAAIAEQQSALAAQQAAQKPYTDLGASATGQYEALLGLPNSQTGAPANPAGIQAALAATPGYQFTKQQGDTSALNAGSLSPSGNTLTALDTFNSGLADQTFEQAVGNAGGAVGIGQAAASGVASNIGATGQTISNALINQGNTTAGIDANTAAGISKVLGNTANQGIEAQTIGALNGYPGGGNPGNLGGANVLAPAGSSLNYDASGNIIGSTPFSAGGTDLGAGFAAAA